MNPRRERIELDCSIVMRGRVVEDQHLQVLIIPLLSDRHSTKYFTYIISFNPHSLGLSLNLMEKELEIPRVLTIC